VKAKLWIITPFEKMQQVAAQVIAERAIELKNCDIEVSTSHTDVRGFQNVLIELRKAQEWGAEVIVSRGGTAAYIMEHTDVPVVEIQVTALDILQAVQKTGLDPSLIGIAGSHNIIYECESLYDFLGIELRQIAISDDNDYTGMRQAVKDGIISLAGDAVAIKFAHSVGMSGVLIESGKASIYKAIREAESVVRVRRREQSRAELLRTIIDASTDGIVAIDESARIALFNKGAEELFHVGRNQARGLLISDILPNSGLPDVLLTGAEEIGEVQIIDAKQIATKRIPIKTNNEIVGVVATFQEVSQLQNYEQSVRQKLHKKGLVAKSHLNQIIGEAPALKRVKELARTYATSNSTVLITGESGTGKELFAQSIHNLSSRRNAPFVAVNCAALPENLLESELFGYEEGAFSGAKRGGKMGLAELAHGGTFFLDEIGEMPLPLQARILRMIQEKEVMRLGGHKVIPVDVRIICATNQDLTKLVANRNFREDLYYRLAVLPLHLPPLRDHPEDITQLANHCLPKFSSGKTPQKTISPDAVRLLQNHVWPGNVREFSNTMERLALLSPHSVIDIHAVESAQNAACKTNSRGHTSDDLWSLVAELRKTGMGARKIAKVLTQQGYPIKYYQISYYFDKEKGL